MSKNYIEKFSLLMLDKYLCFHRFIDKRYYEKSENHKTANPAENIFYRKKINTIHPNIIHYVYIFLIIFEEISVFYINQKYFIMRFIDLI